VSSLGADSATVTRANVNPIEPRTVAGPALTVRPECPLKTLARLAGVTRQAVPVTEGSSYRIIYNGILKAA